MSAGYGIGEKQNPAWDLLVWGWGGRGARHTRLWLVRGAVPPSAPAQADCGWYLVLSPAIGAGL